MSIEESAELLPGKKPKFCVVELEQLEMLLQRCPSCGSSLKAPGGRPAQQPRIIQWGTKGTSMTATINCGCTKSKKCTWSTQSFISGTNTRIGNLTIVAAAQVSGIAFTDLHSFFDSASIAGILLM